MHQTAVPSHYGQKVIIDQCGDCGGLWFDAFELYRIKQGADELIEELDSDILRESSDIGNPSLICPRDKTALFQFDDPRFPKEIILMRCPACQGFWLNRGEFARYQQALQDLKTPKEKSLADKKLDEEVKQLLASYSAGNNDDVLHRVGSFLSTPLSESVTSPLGVSQSLADKGSNLDTVLNVLVLLLRLFVFRS